MQWKVAVAVAISKRSVEKNNLIYSEYLGGEIVDSQPHKNFRIEPIKLERVWNTQKRLSTRLRNFVKSRKSTTNLIHSKNKLTETMINNMQNYYGLAIPNNRNYLYGMKKAVEVILFHCTEINDESSRNHF